MVPSSLVVSNWTRPLSVLAPTTKRLSWPRTLAVVAACTEPPKLLAAVEVRSISASTLLASTPVAGTGCPLLAARAQVGIDAAQLRRRVVAPAVVVDGICGEIGGEVPSLTTGLHGNAAPPEGAAAQLRIGAAVGESVLHVDGERTAECIEPVDRIARHHRHAIDGRLRDEVPVDDIAEYLVHPHAVLIDRQSLRGAYDRRGDETPVVEVALEFVAGLVTERDAGKAARYGIEQVGGLLMLEIGGSKCLHVCRNLIDLNQGRIERHRCWFS